MYLIATGSTPILMLFAGAPGLGPSATISENGGAFGSAANTPVDVGNGWYSLLLALGETDQPGALAVHLNAGTPSDFLFQVGAEIAADVGKWRGVLPAALVGDLVPSAVAAMANGVISGVKLDNDVIAKLFSGVALVESYAADGAAATPAQLLYGLLAALTEFSISGATMTVKKLDGVTAAMTFTLSPAGNPTSRARSS